MQVVFDLNRYKRLPTEDGFDHPIYGDLGDDLLLGLHYIG